MNLFSISQLSQFSGIKPHTIRIWEQRYNALKPSRSEGNTRYYDDIQLRRLLNIVSLLNNGHKVSSLCSMPDEVLFRN
jgi:DNA-binding transcriptional MerR regulator